MENRAGPCLARSGMGFGPPCVQHSLKLHHSHVHLAQTPCTQGSLLPWGLRVPTGQTRLPARGLPRVWVVGGPGEAPGGREGLEKVLEGFQAPMGLTSQPRPHKGYCFGADSVWPRILHSPPWGTAGIQGQAGPTAGGRFQLILPALIPCSLLPPGGASQPQSSLRMSTPIQHPAPLCLGVRSVPSGQETCLNLGGNGSVRWAQGQPVARPRLGSGFQPF